MVKKGGIVTGVVLITVSLLGIFFGILSIIDPVGAKMSDDNAPFGPPPTIWDSVIMVFVYIIVGIIGSFLVIFLSRRKA